MNERIQRLGLIMGVGFCLLLAALTRLQVVDANSLSNDPRNSRGLSAAFSADRGSIQTSDGVLIAHSVPTTDEFKRQRQYPDGPTFAPVTGYLSFTYGADGAERAFNDDLSGGAVAAKGDQSLRQLFQKKQHQVADVTLTINANLQRVAAAALGTQRGAVIALDPTTGAVLAMVSSPSYDPNPLAAHAQDAVRAAWTGLQNDPSRPLLPRAYRESYPPGSTFKVVTASAAFDHAPDLTSKTYPTLKELKLPTTTKTLHNFNNERCGGQLPEMLVVSCDTGFAQMGLDIGADGLSAEAAAFGLDSQPPLDLPATATSRFPVAADFIRDLPGLAFSAIGQQNVSTSPLQMALVASAIANGGVIMKPHVLDHTADSKGNVVRKYTPSPWRTATSPQTADALKGFMINVVARGTATRAQIPGVTVAAKTGTAQTGRNTAHAWLIAFAPAEAPKIAIAVIVEDQTGEGEAATGGRVAAPIAQAVMKAALGA